jgi:hypothetical protein
MYTLGRVRERGWRGPVADAINIVCRLTMKRICRHADLEISFYLYCHHGADAALLFHTLLRARP